MKSIRLGLLALSACAAWALAPSPSRAAVAAPEPPVPPTLAAPTPSRSLEAGQVDAWAAAARIAPLAGRARCGVQAWRLSYRTLDGAGAPVTATAAVLVPRGAEAVCSGPRPAVMLARGTEFRREADMAALEPAMADAGVAAALYAAQGWVVIAPNYVGYAGSSAAVHPYYVLGAQARDARDAIVAARQVAPLVAAELDGSLFLSGYSQGGAVALATQRLLEAEGVPTGWRLQGVAAGAGAYLIGTMAERVFASGDSVGASGFLPLLVTAHQHAGANIYRSLDEVYMSPFDRETDQRLLPGARTYPELLAAGLLPRRALDAGDGQPFLVKPAFRAAFNADPAHPLRRALRAQNLDGWTPKAPLLMCHGAADPLVTYDNTARLHAEFAARKAPVTLLDLEDRSLPLGRGFGQAMEGLPPDRPRALAYHFVAMPFCHAAALQHFERLRAPAPR